MTIGNSVKSIGDEAFSYCRNLASVYISDLEAWCGILFTTWESNPLCFAHHLYMNGNEITNLVIPDNVTSIGQYGFGGSDLTSLTIDNGVKSIGDMAFGYCRELTSVTIGNSVKSIGEQAFYECNSLTSVTIGNNVKSIGDEAFSGCSGLTSVTIPNSVTSIGDKAFSNSDIPEVISKIKNPFNVGPYVFSQNTILNATLYVPIGTIDKYKSTEGWKNFVFIEEEGGSNTPPEPKRCEKPTIGYSNGKLTFNCSTEGATCQSTITDTDIASYSGNEVQLGVTYNISVYATKLSYNNSEIATATLCWIESNPQMDGIVNDVAEVKARAFLVKTDDGNLTVEGANDDESVSIYTTNGIEVGNGVASNGTTTISTNLQKGNIAVVKVGDKSVKVLMK